jgi:hypothetical protein
LPNARQCRLTNSSVFETGFQAYGRVIVNELEQTLKETAMIVSWYYARISLRIEETNKIPTS